MRERAEENNQIPDLRNPVPFAEFAGDHGSAVFGRICVVAFTIQGDQLGLKPEASGHDNCEDESEADQMAAVKRAGSIKQITDGDRGTYQLQPEEFGQHRLGDQPGMMTSHEVGDWLGKEGRADDCGEEQA
jgi:hypothetical protein